MESSHCTGFCPITVVLCPEFIGCRYLPAVQTALIQERPPRLACCAACCCRPYQCWLAGLFAVCALSSRVASPLLLPTLLLINKSVPALLLYLSPAPLFALFLVQPTVSRPDSFGRVVVKHLHHTSLTQGQPWTTELSQHLQLYTVGVSITTLVHQLCTCFEKILAQGFLRHRLRLAADVARSHLYTLYTALEIESSPTNILHQLNLNLISRLGSRHCVTPSRSVT